MRCLKKVIIGFGIFLPVLLSVLFVSPSYAVSDISYTVTQSDANGGFQSLCSSDCSDYSYLLVTFSDLVLSNPSYADRDSVSITISSVSTSQTLYIYPFLTNQVLYFIDNSSSIGFYKNQLYRFSSYSYTVTLSENNPLPSSCPEPEEPEPCPVVPETPYGDQLNNITLAIYTCGGILLVLYFFYCIYRIIIKNSGVNNL